MPSKLPAQFPGKAGCVPWDILEWSVQFAHYRFKELIFHAISENVHTWRIQFQLLSSRKYTVCWDSGFLELFQNHYTCYLLYHKVVLGWSRTNAPCILFTTLTLKINWIQNPLKSLRNGNVSIYFKRHNLGLRSLLSRASFSILKKDLKNDFFF